MIRAVIFDLDGTLVDSAPDIHAAALALLEERGAPPVTLTQIHGFVGSGIASFVERCLDAVGRPVDGPELDKAAARFKEIYGAAPAELTRPYDGVEAMLGTLGERGLLLGVCTNKLEAFTRQVLAGVGLDRHLHATVGGDTLSVMKPEPAPLLHCANLLGVAIDEALFVGDSETDADTATAAGMGFALYSGGYRKRPLDQFKDCFIFDDFTALTQFIEARIAA
ncbi:MAG TPA: phosphoglycolate phosphatase [Thermohalobaculum sp.]|nr:phosphoglycolate phosphatase [Thermohalobaculum sp.]